MLTLMVAFPLESFLAGSALIGVAGGLLAGSWQRRRRPRGLVRARRVVRFETGHASPGGVWQTPSYVDPDFTRVVRRGDMPTAVIPRQRQVRRG